MDRPLRLLHIEDSDRDAELLVRQLRLAGYHALPERVWDAASLRNALAARCWDLIVCDYRLSALPSSGEQASEEQGTIDAPSALAILRESGRDIPFLVVSGVAGEALAVAMMRAGAADYLMKDNLRRLGAAVDRALREAASRAENRESGRRLAESEALLSLALESTDTDVYDIDLVTGEAKWSDVYRRLLGQTPEAEPGVELYLQSVHPEDRDRIRTAFARAVEPGGSGHCIEEYRTRPSADGVFRWIAGSGQVLRDDHGKPVRYTGVVRDVTEAKRAEHALQYQLRLSASIAEGSANCIMLLDRHGAVERINPATERAFGYSLEEFRAQSPHDLFHPTYPDGSPFPLSECRLYHALLSGEVVREMEDVFRAKDGTPVNVSASCAPVELNGECIGTVFTLRVITSRKRAEKALLQSNERFRRLFEADILGILVTQNTCILETNDQFLRMLGYSAGELTDPPATWMSISTPDTLRSGDTVGETLCRDGVCAPFERTYRHKNGRHVPVLVAGVKLNEPDEGKTLWFTVDLTERKELENRFRQAQKLESIGLLAGGIAHDFNNLLTIIIGYTEMALDTAGPRHPLRVPLEQIAEAAEKASGLTRQMLNFSRGTSGVPENILLDSLVSGLESMLRRLIGPKIRITISPGAHDGFIRADPVLIEQVIVNLAVNARDAMPGGGKLLIETSWLRGTSEPEAAAGTAPEDRLAISVTDTGTGMTPEVQSHLYEPFFTTKPPGKGTGLGLSTVYGIVQQSGGSISFCSTPGVGTSFRVLLPALTDVLPAEPPPQPGELPARGAETVLLVEDEEAVRNYVRHALASHGYEVLSAAAGAQALELATFFPGPIHLLLSDVVLPGMKGSEVIRRFRELRPGVPVLCISGYPDRDLGIVGTDIPLLPKPFRREVLLARIRELLSESR